MPSFNKVIFAGHLTRDPEMRTMSSGTSVCSFGMAANRKWSQNGQEREEVCFIDVTAFGKTGETIQKHLSKGRALLIEGRLKFDQWTDKAGNNRSKLGVVCDSFTFIDSKRQAEPEADYPSREPTPGGSSFDPQHDDGIPF